MTGTSSGSPTSGTLPLQWPLVGRHDELDLFTTTLADPRAHGFVIHGSAGVGKTRLSDQCLALADRAGRNVARATATDGSSAVPLGALAHLLPAGIADERCDLVAVMAEVRPVLLEQAKNGPLVLFIDDLHVLDVTSATLVGHLVDADLIFLIATVRADNPVPGGLDALWHRARVRRIDLDDLDRSSVDSLLHLVLGGPVEASTINEIWTASQGNVLFVRELVLGAVERGHLVDQRGVWRLTGPLVTTSRLHELIATRLGDNATDAADALDILAVWEPIGLSTLESMVGGDRLEQIDRLGLIALQSDRRRQRVRLAHPLYGEILRARMPLLTRRRLLLEQVDRINAHGARRREDAIRIATATLEAMGSADPVSLVQGARLARYGHDFRQVEMLSRAALMHGMTPEAGLLLGEALHEIGTYEEADDVLTAAEASAEGHELLVHIVEMRSRNLMWGLRRDDDALQVNREGRGRLVDDVAIEELNMNEAMLLTYSGRPREALHVVELSAVPSTTRTHTVRALAEVPALIATGQCERALNVSRRAFAEQLELPDQVAIPGPGVHVIMQIYALAECGRLNEATALATAAYQATPANAPPDGWMWLAFQQGRCALMAGRVETARRWLSEALARCEQSQIHGASRLVLSALGTAQAILGDAAAAAHAAGELGRLEPFAFVRPEQEFGRAWALVAAGDLPAAREVLGAAAADAAESGYVSSEAWLLHDVARLGKPASVIDRLIELADRSEGDLIAAYADHASASVSGDPQRLTEVSDRFERIGAMLLAAEAANEAAQAFQAEGDRRSSAAARLRASTLAEACEGATTPGLASPVMIAPLTSRERDIATLAASGESSKEIADRLFLSIRTVNNHLQNVYSKLGVSGRHQLAAALADVSIVNQ